MVCTIFNVLENIFQNGLNFARSHTASQANHSTKRQTSGWSRFKISSSSLRNDLQLNGYPQGFTDSVINSKGSSHLNKEQKPLDSVYILYVKGVSEKFKGMGN
jgi:hypothetical protein